MKSFLLSALLVSSSIAADLTIKTGVLESKLTINGTFIASDVTVLQIEAQQWSSFVVSDLIEHGATVKQGDPLITFKNEDYQKKLLEAQESAKSRQLALANAERKLADLKVSSPRTLEGLKLAHDRAKEALEDFNNEGRALSEQEAKERLERSKRALSYQEEELKQLLKMYQEDGITEETEEIILKRQRASVKSAKFSLKVAQKSSSWALAKTIPRKAVDLQRTYDDALLAYETGKVTLPRTLEEKTLALAKLKRDHANQDQKLTELEADGQFLSLAAPADGIIYYGEITKHSWSLGSAPKYLRKNASVPANTALMTFVPNTSPLTLHGSLGQAERLNLPAEAKGETSVTGLKNSAYPTTVTSLGAAPNDKNQYSVAMSIDLPADSPIVTGMKAKVTLSTFHKEDVISVPSSAITTKDGISTIKLKMADGQNEVREVKLGHVAAKKTEILSGLEVGQVIIVPDAPPSSNQPKKKAQSKTSPASPESTKTENDSLAPPEKNAQAESEPQPETPPKGEPAE